MELEIKFPMNGVEANVTFEVDDQGNPTVRIVPYYWTPSDRPNVIYGTVYDGDQQIVSRHVEKLPGDTGQATLVKRNSPVKPRYEDKRKPTPVPDKKEKKTSDQAAQAST